MPLTLPAMLPEKPDPTPDFSAPTDVTPVGREGKKPPHELTGAEEADLADWDAIAADPEFVALLRSKARFIVPATIFFVLYYFALPILVGWFPQLMAREVTGGMNWAYLFALSQFFMAWVIAFLYVAAAAGWDRKASALLARFPLSEK